MQKYSLYYNHLTEDDPNDYYARVRPDKTAGFDDLIEDCVDFGTTLNKPEIAEVVDLYVKAIRKRLNENQFVHVPGLGTFKTTISGKFMDKEQIFDGRQHRISVALDVDSDLQNAVHRDGAQKVKAIAPTAILDQFTQYDTDAHSGAITSGEMAEITGELLQIDKEALDEGIFFVNQADKSEIRVLPGRNRNSLLVFTIPDLPNGTYRIQVRNHPNGVKELRSGEYPWDLIVE